MKGAADALNETLDSRGVARYARNAIMDGVGRLKVRPGTVVAMTLKDDGGGPANVTSIVAIVPWADGALAVAHSTVTQKFYLYRFNSELTGWYNAGGVLQSNAIASPVGVLWTVAATPAKVYIAEGLGEAYIAHSNAGANFKSQKYTVAGGIVALQADLDGGGLKDTFFRGLVSFQQHLWGWGYGSQAVGDNDRPELLRFGFPNFATTGGGYFSAADSITVGHRVRSAKERVIAAAVGGDVLYIGTAATVWPVTGFGRNSWDKSRALDDSYGFAGGFATVEANDTLYYWSKRGLMSVAGLNKPQLLGIGIATAVASVVSAADIVLTFDADRDQVVALYRNATSGRVSVLAGYDIAREVWLGPDGDIGLGIGCAGVVDIASADPAASAGPAGPPTIASTTAVGQTVATANWVNGDVASGVETILEIKPQADPTWVLAASVPAGQTTYQFTGLTEGVAYEWRAKHIRNGQSSPYLGPVAGSQFNTVAVLLPPSGCVIVKLDHDNLKVTWVNSGESGVATEVYMEKGVNPPTAYIETAPSGQSSSIIPHSGSGTYYARVRHTKSGLAPSAYSNVAQVTIVVF